jgi:hypothetical protein
MSFCGRQRYRKPYYDYLTLEIKLTITELLSLLIADDSTQTRKPIKN